MLRPTLFLLGIVVICQGRYFDTCALGPCFPPTVNLIGGREHLLKASSTCGSEQQERYCVVSPLDFSRKCFICDSRDITLGNPTVNHRIENVLNRFAPGSGRRSWWQSEAGVQNVSIEIPFGSEFIMTHIMMTFKSSRPAAMLIEKSNDFGKTWQVYSYFANDCAKSFPGISTGRQTYVGEPICDSRFSRVNPLTEGEVVFRPLPATLKLADPKSPEILQHLKLTNLRINFTKLYILDENNDVSSSYYALYDLIVRGSCYCNGHATRCQMEGESVVMGQCLDCQHNTQGENCERCADNYFLAGDIGDIDACQACNCNPVGSIHGVCDAVSGQCSCQPGLSGRDCSVEDITKSKSKDSSRPQYFPWAAFYRFFMQGDDE